MPSRKELVAHGRDCKAIEATIGADLVIFQTLPDLVESVRQFNPAITNFDCSVFTGEYITGYITEEYLQKLEGLRSDNMRSKTVELDTGALEGNGNGSTFRGTATDLEPPTDSNIHLKADDTVGLHNSFKPR